MATITEAEFREWFPAERPPPPPGSFEFGLVLAGAASAGAYTAGVLDFLFEALDRWHAAKRAETAAGITGEARRVPHHSVRLQALTGASAGGINGAIAAVALRDDFPPIWPLGKRGVDPGGIRLPEIDGEGDASRNPFYAAWVEQIDIEKLLGTGDLDGPLRALLDCTILARIVTGILGYHGPPLADRAIRGWLPDPLPLTLTVTNLRGVPYQVLFRAETPLAHQMSLHRDRMCFAVAGLGPDKGGSLPPDFHPLMAGSPLNWDRLGNAALATGAFPVALRARRLKRPGGDYDYRHPLSLGLGEAFDPDALLDRPAWGAGGPPEAFDFIAVDGGVMDNEPFEIARRSLAGVEGRNPREGNRANRAVVMIDPVTGPGQTGPMADDSLTSVAPALLGALLNQTRFTSRDRMLIGAEDVYSRFLIAPSRGTVEGAEAIASGGLGAFLGFFSAHYRRHDYMLGRRNCQRFLQASFTLPADNPLFDGAFWSASAKETYRDRSGAGDPSHLQIIPCVGACAVPEPAPAWPAGRFRYGDGLHALLSTRTDRLVALARDSALGRDEGLWNALRRTVARGYLWPGMVALRGTLKKTARAHVEAAVRALDERRF
ncbi:hypothetical protein [Oceanibacterium hippocampi]|uniref:Patatin-like phospholipase n=1 Tax=Oceanibacterium hippocampi TaxID=745714 RepID=A0A1Y5SBV7_9PROT|nr:hypothetical protein [Oceanibacterium hippocampi]SLN36413.1 Patatin-like phospholipase [Oceanibacterium hippocampi]